MNNLDKDIAEIIGEISKVATLINMQGKHNAFVNDSGHVKRLEIKLYLGGWKSGCDPNIYEDISYDEFYGLKKSLKKLKKVRDVLNKIYKNGRINMENCNYEIVEVKHYKFY